MRFCMITTFFGPGSFGGDAVFVEHLCRALLRRGHEVEVIHSDDAFRALSAAPVPRPHTEVPGLRVHSLRTRTPLASSLWIQQTSRLGAMRRFVQPVLDAGRFDVIHFHNVSLIGGAQALTLRPASGNPVKLMTAHEHWLQCPLSSLWKFDREVCVTPQCVRCSLQRGRPPQLWRMTSALPRALGDLDALLFPSRHALALHRGSPLGASAPRADCLPNFLPEDWAAAAPDRPPAPAPARPYFFAAGRLVPEKGFARLIPLMKHFPGVDLLIAGAGRSRQDLLRLAAEGKREGHCNVHFEGMLSSASLAALCRHAVAAIVPSAFYETFGYVAVEAMSLGTPVILHDHGALPELLQSGGGLSYRTDEELLAAMRRLLDDPGLRARLSAEGPQACRTLWSEEKHIGRYLDLIAGIQSETRK